MDGSSPTILTKEQARDLVRARIATQFQEQISIADASAAEHAFGWVFSINSGENEGSGSLTAKLPRTVIVNKYSKQVVANNLNHAPANLIRLYEKLLAKSRASTGSWCLTVAVRWPWELWKKNSIAEHAKKAGFYEIPARENQT
jgi:hypothetical protein